MDLCSCRSAELLTTELYRRVGRRRGKKRPEAGAQMFVSLEPWNYITLG